VAAVSAQVILNALFIADIYEYLTEYASPGSVGQGDGQSALQHVLQESYRFEADAFAAGIRSTDDEDVLPPAELLSDYFKKRKALDHEIDRTLAEIQKILGIEINLDD